VEPPPVTKTRRHGNPKHSIHISYIYIFGNLGDLSWKLVWWRDMQIIYVYIIHIYLTT
jgi:hypothetical protein